MWIFCHLSDCINCTYPLSILQCRDRHGARTPEPSKPVQVMEASRVRVKGRAQSAYDGRGPTITVRALLAASQMHLEMLVWRLFDAF